jgi:hypothetical protein
MIFLSGRIVARFCAFAYSAAGAAISGELHLRLVELDWQTNSHVYRLTLCNWDGRVVRFVERTIYASRQIWKLSYDFYVVNEKQFAVHSSSQQETLDVPALVNNKSFRSLYLKGPITPLPTAADLHTDIKIPAFSKVV